MNFARLFLILTLALLVSRLIYGKPLFELFSRSTWLLCSSKAKSFLKKRFHSSTKDDLRYHNLKLACKKCPVGMKRTSSDPNAMCWRTVKHYKSGKVNTNDSKCDFDCYKKRCSDNKMIMESLDDVSEDYSKDYKSMNLKCRPRRQDLIGQ